jgi:hypothetical protein
MKLPKADPDAPVSWAWISASLVLTTLAVAAASYGIGYLLVSVSPNQNLMSSPWDFMLFGTLFIMVFMIPLTVLFRFAPGPARRRQEEREDLGKKIKAYWEHYPDSPRTLEEFLKD